MSLTPRRLWFGLFAVWLVLLSGVGMLGAPGVLQVLRLERLKASREATLLRLEQEVASLEAELRVLQADPKTQLREIRKVLGYVGSEEWVFDFKESGSRF